MSAFDRIAARLLAQARAIIDHRKQEQWWRWPQLLWPGFTKD